MKVYIISALYLLPIHTNSMSIPKAYIVEPKPDYLIEAIMQVESGGDTLAHNLAEDAVGCLQIRPIMVREINRLLGKDSFKLKDRWSKAKSIQMFNILRSHLKGATDEQIARTWNGGYNGKNIPQTMQYWVKVKQYTLNKTNTK
jgi:soluble lytic murein transglycosylase-like protein